MEKRPPLAGRRVVVTRPREQADRFVVNLERRGAEVVLAPLIKVDALVDRVPWDRAILEIGEYDWLVFTSANGVRAFLPDVIRARGAGGDLKICAIGDATAAAVVAEGGRVDLLPGEYVAESVVEAFRGYGTMAGMRVLLARAESGREVVPEALRQSGADVMDLAVYRTVPDEEGARRLRVELVTSPVDVITFTSSSTARNFSDLVGSSVGSALTASIGPVTSATIREMGWRVDIEARVYSADGLLDAITNHFSGGND